jgi:hypothetical protein
MGTTLIELIRENKQRGSFTTYHSLVVDERLPVPLVGDTVIVWKGKRAKGVRIERRNFWYTNSGLYLQLFFTKTE